MDENLKNKKGGSWLVLTVVFVLASILYILYVYVFQNKYDFLVESGCVPEQEVCFVRDCSTGECPPNNLENYSQFMIEAGDFNKCPDGDCGFVCEAGVISCKKLSCEEEGEECSSF